MINELRLNANIKSIAFQFYILLVVHSIYSLFTLLNTPNFYITLVNLILLNLVSIILYFTLKKFKNFINLHNVLITSLIIFNLVFTSSYLIPSLILIFSILLSILLRINNRPIINPAVLGLLIFALIDRFMNLDGFVGWWGAPFFKFIDNDILTIFLGALLFVAFSYYSYKYKKIHLSLGFVISYFLIQVIFGISSFDLNSVFIDLNTVAFLGLVMISEPKTAINFKNNSFNLTSGIILGLILFAMFRFNSLDIYGIRIPNVELVLIIIANIFSVFTNKR